jgi:hypothetical protein
VSSRSLSFSNFEDMFSVVHTNSCVWLNRLCLGADDVSAERRKSGNDYIYLDTVYTTVPRGFDAN